MHAQGEGGSKTFYFIFNAQFFTPYEDSTTDFSEIISPLKHNNSKKFSFKREYA